MAERMKNASVAWETVKADSSQRQVYQDMADQQNAEGRSCLETLDQQQKDAFIRKVCKEFRKLIEMLSTVGQNVAIMIADQDSLQCRTLGTIKGEDWMDARMELEGQLAAYCAGNPDPKTQDKSKDMRKKVKELFNRKYSAGAGLGTIRSVPYSQVDLYPERFRITGLPDGVTLKRPASYGRDKLERILEAADALTFQVVEGPRCQQSGQPGQKSARSGQPPASTEASPEAEPESGPQHTKPEIESQSAPQYTESGQHSAQPGVKPTTPLTSGSPEAPMDQATASDILSALANGGHTLEEYVDQEYREVKKEERKGQKRRAKTARKTREKQLCIEIEKL